MVDGNDLQCEGAMEIIRLCADQAQEEAYEKEEEARRKEEEEAERALRGQSVPFAHIFREGHSYN